VSSEDAQQPTPIMFSSTLCIAMDCALLVYFTYTPKYGLKVLPSILQSTFSSALQRILSRTLPVALNGTLPACLTVSSQVSSQDTLNDLPRILSRTVPLALDESLPVYLALHSQVHSQATRYCQTHVTICSHVCSSILNPETCIVVHARYQVA